MKPGIVYVIHNPAFPEWVKVGLTTKSSMKSRLSTYQTSCPMRGYRVLFEHEFDDVRAAEKMVHEHLSGFTKSNREWFKVHPKLAQNIVECVREELA